MRIECPDCKLSGNIDDSTVPATGLAMTCPRCKKQFTVERPAPVQGGAGAMLDSCPKCQYSTFSDEKFAVCPKCGLVVADYHKEQLAARQNQKGRAAVSPPPQRAAAEQSAAPLPKLSPEQQLKEESARRKYGLDKVPGVVEVVEAPAAKPAVDTPLPLLIAGWGTVIVSILLVGFGISGVMEYLGKVKEAQAAIEAFEETRSGAVIFMEFLVFPVVAIIYSLVMLVFASQFITLKRWSIAALRNGAWAGVGILTLMKIADMVFWFKRASADASFGYYAMGVFGDVMLMLFFIAPYLVLAEYLKSPLFEKSEKMFS